MNLTWTDVVNGRVRMIDPPVKPVVFQYKYLLQLLPCEQSAGGFAFEVPRAAGFTVNQMQHGVLSDLFEKLQPPAVDSPVERTHGSFVVTQQQHDGSRTNHVHDRALIPQCLQRIRL